MTRKREFPLAQVYGLLEPGPVVLVTPARAGRANVMPMSWPIVCSVGASCL
jgi:flavin reductase (DIM6/NTAB) family NADH-FMN oxidoreductase RutF